MPSEEQNDHMDIDQEIAEDNARDELILLRSLCHDYFIAAQYIAPSLEYLLTIDPSDLEHKRRILEDGLLILKNAVKVYESHFQ